MRVSVERLRTLLAQACQASPREGWAAYVEAWHNIALLTPAERVAAAKCYAAVAFEPRVPHGVR